MAPKPAPKVYMSSELFSLMNRLSPDDKFRKWIEDMKIVLKEDMEAGEPIRKKQIPRHYTDKYGVNNLHRYAHPEAYRSCYTLVKFEGVGVCPVILDLLSHSEYDRIFGYETT